MKNNSNHSVGSREKPVFTFTSPHYHNGWCWDLVRPLLKEEGFDSLAVDLPISDPTLTRDMHAEIIREAERQKGAENYIEVGASWGADLSYRKLGDVPVSAVVLMGAPLRPVIDRLGLTDYIPSLHNYPSLAYHALVKAEENGAEFDRYAWGEVFYRGIGDMAIKNWAIENLEPHPHTNDPSDENAILPADVETHFVGFVNDQILSYESQVKTADALGLDFIPFPSGHFGMLEKPRYIADLLTQVARKDINVEGWRQLEKEERLKKLKKSPKLAVGFFL